VIQRRRGHQKSENEWDVKKRPVVEKSIREWEKGRVILRDGSGETNRVGKITTTEEVARHGKRLTWRRGSGGKEGEIAAIESR